MKSFCRALWAPLLFAGSAFALPPEQSNSDTDDDATVTLTVLDQFLVGDARSFCRLRVEITGEQEELRNNDNVILEVYENDFAGNDEIWRQEFRVTGDEVEAQHVDRTFDCSGPFGEGDGIGGNFELVGKATVEKDACGGFCRYDRPTTSELDLTEVDGDDDAEEDDASADGFALPLGNTAGRIARDADWFALSFLDRSVVTFRVLHRDAVGRVEAILYDADGGQIAVGEALPGETVVVSPSLAPGSYNVRVQPADGNDFNFYDVSLSIVSGGGCDPGSMELRPCGRCGEQRRLCLEAAEWGEWGECEAEGDCAPGDARSVDCGNCGTITETCNVACDWEAGPCENEGACEPESEELQDCPGGTQRRLCDLECQWGEFEACQTETCEPGEVRACYPGPDATANVGLCSDGEEACVDGDWADECVGAVIPVTEVCGDGADNDCDGDVDGDDSDCDGPQPPAAELGDACTNDDDCGPDLVCLRPDDAPAFRDGYCSVTGCAGCPEDGVCGRAFGRDFCLARCAQGADCTAQQRCADVSSDTQLACVPVCLRDSDCLDPAQPLCDRTSRLCVPAPAPTPDRGLPEPPRDMGVGGAGGGGAGGFGGGGVPADGGADAGEEARPVAEGCTVGADLTPLVWLGLLLLPAVRRRR